MCWVCGYINKYFIIVVVVFNYYYNIQLDDMVRLIEARSDTDFC